jgi:hypothetical protein
LPDQLQLVLNIGSNSSGFSCVRYGTIDTLSEPAKHIPFSSSAVDAVLYCGSQRFYFGPVFQLRLL